MVLEALTTMIQPAAIEAALDATGRRERRDRRLRAAAMMWLVIGFGLWSHANIPTIWRRLCGTLRSLFRGRHGDRPPVKSAFSQARRRLTAAPVRRLFRQTARPLATPHTPGAFYHGRSVKIIDGVHLDIPDTVDNAAAFGRPGTRRFGTKTPGACPQVLAVCLSEAGTHVILDRPDQTGAKRRTTTRPEAPHTPLAR